MMDTSVFVSLMIGLHHFGDSGQSVWRNPCNTDRSCIGMTIGICSHQIDKGMLCTSTSRGRGLRRVGP